MEKNNLCKNQPGFTLLEILVVLSIIGTIIAIGTVSYNQVLITSRDSARKSDIQSISSALEQYKSNNIFGSYPTDLNSLLPTYITVVPKDPKIGQDYTYSASPSGCLATKIAPCMSYNLTATLEEDAEAYTVNPYGEQ